MKLNDVLLNEELQLIKFRYPSKHCARPRVLVLDPDYKGKKNEKHYGETSDVLGVNIQYIKPGERKEAKEKLSSIDLFSDFLDANKLERYNRLKDLSPEYLLPFIRRYKKDKMKGVKERRGMFYHKLSFIDKKDIDLGEK